MMLIMLLAIFFSLSYAGIWLYLRSQLKADQDSDPEGEAPTGKNFISVLVAYRDEEAHLPALLSDLEAQRFPGHQWELLLIDDHSCDKGPEIIGQWLGNTHINARHIHYSGQEGKKGALALGHITARGTVLVQTDADCRLPKLWLLQLAGHWPSGCVLRMGSVAMRPGRGFWSRFAALEYMSLQAAGIAFARSGRPFMGSAASIAYRASLLQGYRAGQGRLSGDDVFLIQRAVQVGEVGTILNPLAQVTTAAPRTWRELLHQRARWGGKAASYPSLLARFIAILVFGYALLQILVLGVVLTGTMGLLAAGLVWVVKAVADFSLLRSYARISRQTKLLRYYPLSFLIYPFYILATVGVILMGTAKWKERSFRPIVD